MLSSAEKQISELMATLELLFTAGEKVAFSQNLTEKEEALSEIERSAKLLESQHAEQIEYLKQLQQNLTKKADYLKYLSEMQDETEKKLSEATNATEVYLILNEKIMVDNLSIVFKNVSWVRDKFEIQLKVSDAADKKIFTLKEKEVAIFKNYAITYEALYFDKEYIALLAIRRESL